jgi:co-chaperonin GroES (HSP10)
VKPLTENREKTVWPFVLCTTASWSGASKVKKKPRGDHHPPGGRDETGKLTPLDVKAGDKVLFGKWSGTEVEIDGQDLLIMKESDILDNEGERHFGRRCLS